MHNYAEHKAKEPGLCTLCNRRWGVGAKLALYDDELVHSYCSGIMKNRDRVNSGETYRSKRKSDYRRGMSPGSYKEVK